MRADILSVDNHPRPIVRPLARRDDRRVMLDELAGCDPPRAAGTEHRSATILVDLDAGLVAGRTKAANDPTEARTNPNP